MIRSSKGVDLMMFVHLRDFKVFEYANKHHPVGKAIFTPTQAVVALFLTMRRGRLNLYFLGSGENNTGELL